MPGCIRDSLVEAELALVLQEQERHRGELLGVGGDLVGQGGAGRQLLVGFPIGLVEHELAVADDGDLGGRDARLGKRLGNELVDLADLGMRERLGGGGKATSASSAADKRSIVQP